MAHLQALRSRARQRVDSGARRENVHRLTPAATKVAAVMAPSPLHHPFFRRLPFLITFFGMIDFFSA
jgi:hypothetical protein